MRAWRVWAAFLLTASSIGQPCTIVSTRTLFWKQPGSESELFAFERYGRVGFIDPTGKVIIAPEIPGTVLRVKDFSNGLAHIEGEGYIDESGKWLVLGEYSSYGDFSDGLAKVIRRDAPSRSGTIAFIDRTGQVVFEPARSNVDAFAEGLAAFREEGREGSHSPQPGIAVYRYYPGRKGYIDRTGSVVIQPAFADAGPFIGGLARVVLDGDCHVLEPSGRTKGTPLTGSPEPCSGGAPDDVLTACGVGFIGRTGEFAIQPKFESAWDFQEGLAAVRTGGLWGFIDPRGAFAISPRFVEAHSFSEGLAAVLVDGKWGFIDKTERMVIQPQFDDVGPFSDGMATIQRGDDFSYIDRTGTVRIAGPFAEATPFVHGLASVRTSDRDAAYIDKTGKTVLQYRRE